MIPRQEQLEFVTSVKIRDNERKSLNCPFCGGIKKFTLSNQDGKILWNCFKASCSVKGAHKVGYSLEAIKSKTFNIKTPRNNSRPIPTILGQPKNYPRVLKYLQDNNCMYAHENRMVKIAYDPQEQRVLFFTNDVGAVGRSLNKRIPKWLSYGENSPLFQCGTSSTCVIVEDPASACSVGSTGVYTGCAILGTNVSSDQMTQLSQYKRHIICLDKDASKTALKLYEKFNFPNVTIKLLEEDLKYLTTEGVMNCLQ